MARDVDDLQLDAVGIVEEHGVIARNVGVVLRAALDLHARLRLQPLGALVDGEPRRRLQRKVVEPNASGPRRSLEVLAAPESPRWSLVPGDADYC